MNVIDDMDFILKYLDKITDLRRDIETFSLLTEREDTLSDPLMQETEQIVQVLLDNYSPDCMDFLTHAIREGKLPTEDSDHVRNRLLEGVS